MRIHPTTTPAWRSYENLPHVYLGSHSSTGKRSRTNRQRAAAVRDDQRMSACADHTSVKRELLKGQKRPTICGLLRACLLLRGYQVIRPVPRALVCQFVVRSQIPVAGCRCGEVFSFSALRKLHGAVSLFAFLLGVVLLLAALLFLLVCVAFVLCSCHACIAVLWQPHALAA